MAGKPGRKPVTAAAGRTEPPPSERQVSRLVVEARENERRAIAEELHNVLGQSLTVLKLLLDKAKHSPAEGVAPTLAEAEAVADEVVTRVRDLSLDLLPSMLDDLGLLPTLLWYCQRQGERTGIHIDFKHAGLDRSLPGELNTAGFRIVQEALANATRYAKASEVIVRVWANGKALFLHVEDHGAGFEPASLPRRAGEGIADMRAQAVALGGKVTVESATGVGTTVDAELPFPAEKRRKVRPG